MKLIHFTIKPAPLLIALAVFTAAAHLQGAVPPRGSQKQGTPVSDPRPVRNYRVVQVFVALCDNKNQGIVPVPPALGNGQNPKSNLYWGAQFGVKTYVNRSPGWELLPCRSSNTPAYVLDEIAFTARLAGRPVYIIAQAYDGAHMKDAVADFLKSAAGQMPAEFTLQPPAADPLIAAGSAADMVCFVGHNGLMDFTLDSTPTNTGQPHPACAVVLACKSRDYFLDPLGKANCKPLITTTGLMAPEAYTLEAIIRSWATGQTPEQSRQAAAQAYAKYQKCSVAPALRLFVVD
jgi:hypothetical protein